ncbi:hypothetical protein Tco_0783559 [Tanacetum coccineum]
MKLKNERNDDDLETPFLSKDSAFILGIKDRNYQIMLWAKGPIFEDVPNFDMAFRLFRWQNDVTIPADINLVKERGFDNQHIKVVQKWNPDAK